MNLVIPAPTPDEIEPDLNSGVFFPSISPSRIREEMRIDNSITAPRLRSALVEAMAHTNAALRNWRIAHQQLGQTTMVDIVAEKINNTSILVHRYQRAVGALAKALILERMPDFDATGRGEKRAEQQADPIDDMRRDWQNAIADITGRARNFVELI